MKFYNLKLKLWDDNVIDEKTGSPRVYPRANGSKVSNSHGFLGPEGKIHMGRFVDDAPVFDYFYLYSSNTQKENDWILLDAYSFGGKNYPLIRGFLISEKFREILHAANLANPFRFYKSKLMYHSEKLDYYILHLAQDEWLNFNPLESVFYCDDEKLDVIVEDNDGLKKIIEESRNQQKTLTMKLVLKESADLFFFSHFYYVVSERLKKSIENAGLKDMTFTELEGVTFESKFPG